MQNSINLISNKKKDLAREKLITRWIRITAILFVFGLFASSVFAFFLKASTANALSQENLTHQASVDAFTLLQQRLIKINFLNDRYNQVGAILNKRVSLDTVMQQVLAQASSGVSINNFSIKDKSVAITANASSLLSMNSFINALFNLAAEKKYFKTITLNSFSESSGTTSVSLSLELL